MTIPIVAVASPPNDLADALDAIPAADLRLLVEHTPVAVAVLDHELRYLVTSRRWLEDYRVSGDLRGRAHWEVFPELPERWREVHRRALRGESASGEEEPFVRGDGRVEWVRWECRPWRRRDGDIGGIVLFTEVVTERRLARMAADASLARLERLLETTRDAVLFIDRNDAIARMNVAARGLFGERRGAPLTTLLPHWRGEGLSGDDRRLLTRTTIALGVGDAPFPAEITWTALDDDGDDVRAIAFVRDATDREREHQSAVTSERLATLGRAAAMFAHEVSNPLTGMALQLQVLSEEVAGHGEDVDAALAGLRGGIQQLTTLLAEFRQLSRPSPTPQFRVALDDVVDRVLLSEELPLRRANVEVSRQLGRAWIIGDEFKLAQVVLNLCRNATEAMHGGGHLRLETSSDDRRARLSVRDDGCGIPPGFDPFALFATTKPTGTGLGLPIVAQIVAAHGGTIEHTPADGGGTVFTMSFPAAL